MRPLLFSLLLSLLFSPAAWAGWDISQLMQLLAKNKGGHATFVETKYISILDQPVVSSGELSYTAPDQLEKKTVQPKAERLTLDGDTLTVERGKRTYTLRLQDRPEAIAFADSIRGTLSGNQKVLEQTYKLQLQGDRSKWTLQMLPSDTRIASLVSKISVSGSNNRVQTIEYTLKDGDRSVMAIEETDSR